MKSTSRIIPTELHKQTPNTSPFGREHLRSFLLLSRKGLYKVLAEVFMSGTGGVLHFWVFHAVAVQWGLTINYFIILILARWMKEQGKDQFKAGDLRICGLSIDIIFRMISRASKEGYFARSGSRRYKLSSDGIEFIDELCKELFNAICDIYDPAQKKPG